MTELEKFQKVNQCETGEQLAAVIKEFADESGLIQGRDKSFDATRMSVRSIEVIEGKQSPSVLTREFGIRQQALYIRYYTQPHPGPAPAEKPDVSDTIEELTDLSKMFDDRISDCYQVKGAQQARHAFILYRSVLWNAIKSLKQI